MLRRPDTYTAYGAARQLWSCKAEEVLIEGPAGTGKSRGALEKINFCCMKYEGMRAVLLRKTRESMSESVLVTFETKVLPPRSPVLEGPKRNLRQNYVYPNGSVIVVGGLDKSSKIMSTDYDMIGVFEGTEVYEPEFEDLTTRLRNGIMPYQQVIIDCNPGPPTHWLNRRPDKEGSAMVRLLSRHEDNPMLFNQETMEPTEQGAKYLAKLDRLGGSRYLRLRKGLWAAAEGVVYDDYDPAIHVLPKRFILPPSWRRFRAVDFGFTNPFVCQWWAIDPDGRLYMYREIYFSRRLVSRHAELIRRLSQSEVIEATVCDWDAEGRATLEEAGIPTTPAYKEIERGIEQVQIRLKKAGDEKPRIFFLPDSTVEIDQELLDESLPSCTLQEFDGYVYPPVRLNSERAKKEEPVDKDNHGMDTMRYAVAYTDGLAGTRFLASVGDLVEVAKSDGPTERELTTGIRSFERPFD